MGEKFSKEMEIIKNNKLEILKMKISINQTQATIESIIRRQDHTEERISEMEDKTEEYCKTIIKKKINTHAYSIQEPRHTTK
jgi:cell division protein FtsB